MDNKDKRDKIRKVKIELEEDVVNMLIKLKNFGDTYSDVVRKILKR